MDEKRLREIGTKIVNARHAPVHEPYGDEQQKLAKIVNDLKELMAAYEAACKEEYNVLTPHSRAEALSYLESAEHIADAILSLDQVIYGMRISPAIFFHPMDVK